MNEQEKDKLLELLSDKAVFGLTDAELAEFAEFEKDFPELNDDSFDLATASIALVDLDTHEPMPAHLQAKIAADAEKYFAVRKPEASETKDETEDDLQPTFGFEPKRSIWQWLGWLVAAFACIALAFNIYTTQKTLNELQAKQTNPTPTAAPKTELTAAQEREKLMASAKDIKQSNWGDIDPKKPKNIQGDVVWSNTEQKGFVHFSNLPVNDKTKQTYQVWIFDKNQKNPVSGGTFDVDKNGEVFIPIDSALTIQEPTMFGVTAEKPGGVMVSDLKEVMAVAKVSA